MMELATVLLAASVAPLNAEEIYAAAYRAASPERRKKADSYRFAKDRALSLGAELLLRRALRMASCGDLEPEYAYGSQGKPVLKNAGIQFSLSHSGEYALCAVSEFDVGCDVEAVAAADLRVAERFFTPEEYADIVSRSTSEARNDLFYRYWTLKESFLKATGRGLQLPMRAFRIVLGEEISVVQAVDEREYSFREFAQIPGYRCALCGAGDCRDAELKLVDLREML